MHDLVAKIKHKKELQGIADSFVIATLEEIIKKNRFVLPLAPKSEKLLIKEVRAKLRRSAGRFATQVKPDSENALHLHASTRERQADYALLKEKIYALKPQSILDIGCGLNPIALAKPGVKYFASDINESDLELVAKHFKKNRLDGQVYVSNALTETQFPEADLALLLKVVDLLDKKGHKRTEQVLKQLQVRHIVVSFSTKTLSGAPMRHPQRGWIEQLLTRLNYSYTIWKTKNEIYYFITKSD